VVENTDDETENPRLGGSTIIPWSLGRAAFYTYSNLIGLRKQSLD